MISPEEENNQRTEAEKAERQKNLTLFQNTRSAIQVFADFAILMGFVVLTLWSSKFSFDELNYSQKMMYGFVALLIVRRLAVYAITAVAFFLREI